MSFKFDEGYYRSTNPDVAAAVASGAMESGFAHFVRFGLVEGRAPSQAAQSALQSFDEHFYLECNADVAQAVRDGSVPSALAHYILFGSSEGRDPGASFDETWYRNNNPDVDAAVRAGIFGCGFEHYQIYGQNEQRPFHAGGSDGVGPSSNHILIGGTGDDVLNAGNGKSVVFGKGGDDVITGDNGADHLYGGDGDDSISGDNGPDFIVGGRGQDTMDGGNGPDVFSFDVRAGAMQSDLGAPDIITGFNKPTDKIEFAFGPAVASGEQTQIAAQIPLLIVPIDPVGKATAIADRMAELNQTDHGVAFAVFGGDTYVLYEADGSSDAFDAANDFLVQLIGVTAGGFSYTDNVTVHPAG